MEADALVPGVSRFVCVRRTSSIPIEPKPGGATNISWAARRDPGGTFYFHEVSG